jgi:LysM repeat protein
VLAVAVGLCVVLPRAAASASQRVSIKNFDDIMVSAVIERPPATSVIVARPAQTVVARAGQTVHSLAAAYHSDESAIRWANRFDPDQALIPGQTVLVPPGPGALVRVLPGETPSAFARRVKLDPSVMLDYNQLSSNAPLPAGTFLQVPLQAAPVGALIPHGSWWPSRACRGCP